MKVPGSDSSALQRRKWGCVRLLRHEAPLHAGRESGPSPAPKARGFHLVDDRVPAHLEGLWKGLIPAPGLPAFDGPGFRLPEVFGEDPDLFLVRVWVCHLFTLGLEAFQNLRNILGHHVLVVTRVDLDRGRETACRPGTRPR